MVLTVSSDRPPRVHRIVVSILMLLAMAAAGEPLILPGDELLLDTPHQPELGGIYQVDVRGALTVDPARPCPVAGLTCDAAADSLSRVLAEFYRDPSGLTLRILHRRLAVRVEGRVDAPGDYVLPPHADLETALLAAGGIGQGGLLTRVMIDRGGTVHEVDLRRFRITGDPTHLLPLATGDRIFVPVSNREAPIVADLAPLTVPFEDPNVVHLLGVVARAGTHAMPGELTLLEALALGGGPAIGSDPSRLRVVPPDGASYEVDLETITTGSSPMPTIGAGTTIVVPERRRGFLTRTIEIAVPVILTSLVIKELD